MQPGPFFSPTSAFVETRIRKVRLLVVEDGARTAAYLVRALTESGHVVDCAGNGETALALVQEGIYDLLVIDRNLPGIDGLALVCRLRESNMLIPILMLSAEASTRDKIEGIQAGCDDYLAKPYAFTELLARIEALARRVDRARRRNILRVADLELDTLGRILSRAGRPILLQHREYLLLEILMRHSGQLVTRSMLIEAAWPYDFEPRGNIVDMYIHRLRQKVDHGFPRPLIRTITGAGYLLEETDVVRAEQPADSMSA